MSRTVGEEFIRLEHKLDAILTYLKGITGERPLPMPSKIPGLGSMTDGKCPITESPIHLKIDPKTGKAVREDSLSSGLIEAGAIIPPLVPQVSRTIVGQGKLGGDDAD